MCAEEAFEPDAPANPVDELAELRKANSGLYAELRAKRDRVHTLERKLKAAETNADAERWRRLYRESEQARRELSEQVEQLYQALAPQPDFHASRVNAAAHVLKSEPIPEPVGPAGTVDLLTERANELSEEIVENA